MENHKKIRLQRFLAEAGVASRRKAEELIKQGRVEINGAVAGLGATVDPERDHVFVDGERVRLRRLKVYIMLYKPKGFLCATRDPKGRPTVYSLLPKLAVRVHSVGRLDFQSEGLLLFTNDGELTRALTHPSFRVERVYNVKVQGLVSNTDISRLCKGVRLPDGLARFEACRILRVSKPRPHKGIRKRPKGKNTWLEVTLTEGRYREIRRMFEGLGYNVLKLRRIRFGPLHIGKMKPKQWRFLTDREIEALHSLVGFHPLTPGQQ